MRRERRLIQQHHHRRHADRDRVVVVSSNDLHTTLDILVEVDPEGVLGHGPTVRCGLQVDVNLLPDAVFHVVDRHRRYDGVEISILAKIRLRRLRPGTQQLGIRRIAESVVVTRQWYLARQAERIPFGVLRIFSLGSLQRVRCGRHCSAPAHSNHQQRQQKPTATEGHLLSICHHVIIPQTVVWHDWARFDFAIMIWVHSI